MRTLAGVYHHGLVWVARAAGLLAIVSGAFYGLSHRASLTALVQDYGFQDELSRAAIAKSAEVSNWYWSTVAFGLTILLVAEVLGLLLRRTGSPASRNIKPSRPRPAHR